VRLKNPKKKSKKINPPKFCSTKFRRVKVALFRCDGCEKSIKIPLNPYPILDLKRIKYCPYCGSQMSWIQDLFDD